MLKVVLEKGIKRPFVIFTDLDNKDFALKLSELIEDENLIILTFNQEAPDSWKKCSEEIRAYFQDKKIRQISCLSFSSTVSVAVNLYLSDLKLFRSIAFLNPHSRSNKSFGQRLIDKLESKLPMGLPFRFKTEAFDCKPFLQRIRCPILIISNKNSSDYRKDEVEEFLERVPTAYIFNQDSDANLSELINAIETFKLVPYKCPQKNKINS